MTKKPAPNIFSDISQQINRSSEFMVFPCWDFYFNQLSWKLLWAGSVKAEGQVPPGHQHCATQASVCSSSQHKDWGLLSSHFLPRIASELKKSPVLKWYLNISHFLYFSFNTLSQFHICYISIIHLLYIERYIVKETGASWQIQVNTFSF